MNAIVIAGGYDADVAVTNERPKMCLPIGEETVTGRIFAELEVKTRIDEGSISTTERFVGDLEGILPTVSSPSRVSRSKRHSMKREVWSHLCRVRK